MTQKKPSDTNELTDRAENPPDPDSTTETEAENPVDSYDQLTGNLINSEKYSSNQSSSDPSDESNGDEKSDSRFVSPETARSVLRLFYDWIRPTLEEDGKRKGLLSTYDEFHILFFGVMVGVGVEAEGPDQLIAAILGSGAAGKRIIRGLPEDERKLVTKELPHFAIGVILGYFIVHPPSGISF